MNHTTRTGLMTATTLLLGSLVAQIATAQAPQTESCDCSCQRYQVLVTEGLPNSPLREQEVLQCAGSCAIAWVRCEEQGGLVEASSSDSDRRDNEGDGATAAPIQASLQSDL